MKRVWLSLLVALIFALSSGVVSSFAAEGSHMDMDGSHMDGDHAKMDCPYCKMMAPHMKENIATLREAAEALKNTNPDLSKKLSDMADMKESMMMKAKEEMKEDMLEGSHMMEGSH